MMPVPEEFVGEVEQYMRWAMGAGAQSGGPTPWTQESIDQFVALIDEESKTLLAHIAEHKRNSRSVTVSDISSATGLSRRSTIGIIFELNDRVSRVLEGGNFILIPIRNPQGEHQPGNWTVAMGDDVASFVLAAIK